MDSVVRSFSLEYGDAEFRIMGIRVSSLQINEGSYSHSHEYYELHYADEGSHVYKCEDNEIELTAGKMLIIPPGVRHVVVEKGSPKYKFSVLSFSLHRGEHGEGFYNAFRTMIDGACLTPIIMPHAFVEHICNVNNSIYCDDIFSYCYLKKEGAALIDELTRGLKKYLPDDFTPSLGRNRDDVLALLDVMIGRNEFSLSDIARHINYSPRHTSRLIKKIYGMSLLDIRRKKLGK